MAFLARARGGQHGNVRDEIQVQRKDAHLHRKINLKYATLMLMSALILTCASMKSKTLESLFLPGPGGTQKADGNIMMHTDSSLQGSDAEVSESTSKQGVEEANDLKTASPLNLEGGNRQVAFATARGDTPSFSSDLVESPAPLSQEGAQYISGGASPGVRPNTTLSEELSQSYFASFIKNLSSSDDPLIKTAGAFLARKQKHGNCNIDDAKDVDPWNRHDGVRRDVAICMQISNDAGIMDEYIAFHWVQGVGKFVIYDDGSSDNIWSVLEKYVALGIVEHHNISGSPIHGTVNLQTRSMNKCFTMLRERAVEEGLRWIAFPDTDEFVLSSIPNETLSETLNKNYVGEACLRIHRTWYGSSFQHKKPSSLVTETYLMASSDYGGGIWNPKLIANIYPEGKPMNATALTVIHNFKDEDKIQCKPQQDIKDIRINHYLRSLEEYSKKSVYKDVMHEWLKEPLKQFFRRDFNLVSSPIAADYSCRVHTLLKQIQKMKHAGKIPAVRRPEP